MSTNPRSDTSRSYPERARRGVARVLAAALVGVSLAGCLAVPPVLLTQRALSDKEPSGDELKQLQQESAPYQKKGRGVVTGMVAMQAGTQQIPAPAGTTVYLTPVTTYATARLQKYAVEENELPAKANAQIAWIGRTEEGGVFRFQDLPAGSYYIVSQMFWTPPWDPGKPRGDVAYTMIQLAPGENAYTVVTRPAPAPAQ
ncbi:MAG TPA: hypothetical protein VFD92_17910 [Candidatus Binatia bacterium]|nr:hypothetical protein [Candidatus Binatia bacterium]